MIGFADNTLTRLYQTEPNIGDAVDENRIKLFYSEQNISKIEASIPFLWNKKTSIEKSKFTGSIGGIFKKMIKVYVYILLGQNLKNIRQVTLPINKGILHFDVDDIPLPQGLYSIATDKINKIVYPKTHIVISRRQKTLL